jgi:Family of unknown function (DUF5755)
MKPALPSSGKKCIPGIICFENMTLFLIVVIGISVGYLYYVHFYSRSSLPTTNVIVQSPPVSLWQQPVADPPYKTIDIRGPPMVPVNISTSTANTAYQQVGILTKQANAGGEPIILPLMGRNLLNGRDKWQYYTMSNSPGANMSARLPISVNGRSCTGEYGCDSVSNGDTVYVEGYNDTFRATLYENATLRYIPY